MKRAPTIKLGKFHIRYIQVPYDDRYYVFKQIGNIYHQEVFIKQTNRDFLDLIFKGLVQNAGYGSLEFDHNLKRFRKFEERVRERDEYLDRD